MAISAAALAETVDGVRGDALVVVTMTSMIEMFDRGEDPLFMSCVPLMGGAAGLGLGLALAQPSRRVLVLDGDASLLMQLGSLVTVSDRSPANFTHVVCHNGVEFEGFANLPIPGAGRVGFSEMARAAGYRSTTRVDSAHGVEAALTAALAGEGPSFIEVIVEPSPPRVLTGDFAHFEIPDHQFERMAIEARRLNRALGAPWFGGQD